MRGAARGGSTVHWAAAVCPSPSSWRVRVAPDDYAVRGASRSSWTITGSGETDVPAAPGAVARAAPERS